MERIPLACGGFAVNSVDNVSKSCLGFADLVYEHVLGEDKFTFIEGCKNAKSCSILVRGVCVYVYVYVCVCMYVLCSVVASIDSYY